MLERFTRGPEETEAIGEALGRLAAPGLVVALQGDLGAGKTVFTKGVACGLGVPAPRYVSSPTFTIHKVYQGRLVLHHLDLYRLSGPADLEDLGLEEALVGLGVCVIEWPDSFFEALPRDRLTVRFTVVSPEERALQIVPEGPRAVEVAVRLGEVLSGRSPREERA